ncbi:MAG: hypothetical protein U9R56_04490, partial [candidate division Zixibacteria bacterium]|nr:hypothetical protein [candidate division Zixibacteria bacterium]
VNLLLADDVNLLLKIVTDGGFIESSSSFSVEQEETTGNSRLVLGNGENSLEVSGDNTNVVIHGPE